MRLGNPYVCLITPPPVAVRLPEGEHELEDAAGKRRNVRRRLNRGRYVSLKLVHQFWLGTVGSRRGVVTAVASKVFRRRPDATEMSRSIDHGEGRGPGTS